MNEKNMFSLHQIPINFEHDILPGQTNFLPSTSKKAFMVENEITASTSSFKSSTAAVVQNSLSNATTRSTSQEGLSDVKSNLQVWTMPSPHEALKGKYLFPSPFPYKDATLAIQPLYGEHRRNHSEVIFSFARGLGLAKLLPFLRTLWDTGFNGDLVLGISNEPDRELKSFLRSEAEKKIGLVVYEIPLDCIQVKIKTHCRTIGMFKSSDTKEIISDRRGYREMAQLRFEYYWAWATLYSPENARIWLLDARDVFFQQNPFENQDIINSTQTTLRVFEESSRFKIREQRSNRRWIKGGYGETWFKHLGSYNVICSGSTFGGQIAIEWYTRAMVHQFDLTNCTIYGCDQGHHNVLIRSRLLEGSEQVTSLHIHPQGYGVVDTVGLLLDNTTLRSLGLLLQNETIINFQGQISSIVHQYDRDEEMRDIMFDRSQKWLKALRKMTKT
eukprot:CAMPEP_0178914738 /NCGR_PEP_ID=MMETSP0786-20121207/11608_1 /TAXON_ID=186022 /ORGANISM="Thalassionema frauenfeldii, Strain CCMP 1798" /LENGTH=443 /DNA_ID=CAMNT_0020587711 /DNA_START=236 /DNA_END=1567 /DNA_ORIENTATION=+